MDEKNNEKRKHPIFAPLQVLKGEPLHIIWGLFLVFFGLINIWGSFFLGRVDDVVLAIKEGIVYVFSISICAPFLAEVLVKLVFDKKSRKETAFLGYRVASCSLNILWIVVLTFLWLGELKSNLCLQVFVGMISILFAFYMYCISQMELYKLLLDAYDDKAYQYLENEKARMEETEEGARQLTTITGSKGDIEL